MRTRILQLMGAKQSREGRKITPSVVAKELGLSRQTIYNWLNDDVKRFEEDMIVKMCDYFDCDMSDLLYLDKEAM